MLRWMVMLPKGRQSVFTAAYSPKMGSLMVDPPSSETVPTSFKIAHTGNKKSPHTQRSTDTHAVAHVPSPSSVTYLIRLVTLT